MSLDRNTQATIGQDIQGDLTRYSVLRYDYAGGSTTEGQIRCSRAQGYRAGFKTRPRGLTLHF